MIDDVDLECDSCDRQAMSVQECECGCEATLCSACWVREHVTIDRESGKLYFSLGATNLEVPDVR